MASDNLGDDFIRYVNAFTSSTLLKDWATFHGYIQNPHVLIRIRELEIFSGLQHSIDVENTWRNLIHTYQTVADIIQFGRKYNVLQDAIFKARLQELEKVS